MLRSLIAAGALVAVAGAAPAADLRFGHVFAADSLENAAVQQLAEAVGERTGGEVTVSVFPAGQLGDVGATFSAMTLGTVDMTMVDISLLGYQKGHEEFFVGQVPYLFKSQDWARRIYNSELFAPFYDRLREEKGIRVVAVAGDREPRSFNTKTGPIFEPADAEGIKIRVLPNPVSIATFEAWGMRPTPISFNELYLALRQDVVEGQDNGLDVTVPMNFHEVTSFYAYSNHVYSLYGWYISDMTWQTLSPEAQAVVTEEVVKAGELISRLGAERAARDERTMLEAGLKVTVPNRPAFEALAADVYRTFEGDLWREGLVEEIRALQQATDPALQ